MAKTDQNAPAEPRFRRRIPLELTPAEFAQLEAAQPRHGSKRATLVAGLDALTHLEDARVEHDRVAAERDAALAQAADLTERVEKAEREIQKAGAKAKTTSRTDTAKTSRLERDVARARDQVAQAEQLLAAERREHAEWQQAYEELDAQRIDSLRCPRCKQWADPDEWGVVDADGGGQLVYHQPCGYHEDGPLTPTTIMGYRGAD